MAIRILLHFVAIILITNMVFYIPLTPAVAISLIITAAGVAIDILLGTIYDRKRNKPDKDCDEV